MSRLNIQNQQITHILEETGVTIYAGVLFPSNAPVSIKETLFASPLEANSALRHAFTLSSLVHSNVLQVLDCYFGLKQERYSVSVVEERGERSLGMEIKDREREGRHWSDEEVMNVLKDLVSALSLAEERGFFPKNIDSASIFFSENTVKIGDFTSISQSISPNPSQSLREVTQIDPAMSSFYSLGVTIAHICLLHVPERFGESLGKELVQYPAVSPFILELLKEKPEEMRTFRQFQEGLERDLPISVPESEENTRNCLSCGQAICSDEWAAAAPRHWEIYKGFYAACCSRQCFEERAFRFSMVSSLRSRRAAKAAISPAQSKPLGEEAQDTGTIQVQYEAYRPDVFAASRHPMRPFGSRRGRRFPH